MTRVTYKSVMFRRSFMLSGLEKSQPPGTYTVEIEEALHELQSALVYRRTATLLHVRTAPGVFQSFPIDHEELAQAQAMDAH